MAAVERARVDAFVQQNVRWNVTVGVVDAVFMSFAIHMVSHSTVLPLLVSRLTPSAVAIGLVGAIYNLGYHLPQLLTASHAEGLRRKRPFVVLLGGVGERLPYLLIGLVVWSLAVPHPGVTLGLLLLLTAISAVSNGVATPAWYSMIAKVIPVERRGRFSGIGHSLGALLGVVGGFLAGQLLEHRPYPQGFALCFLVAAAAMAVSWAGLALTREPPSIEVRPRTSLPNYLRRLPGILHGDRNYRRFLLAWSVVVLGGMGAGFVMVYGAERFQVGGTEVGWLTALLVGTQALANLLWGTLADRSGHKVVLCGSGAAMALAAAAVLAAPSLGVLAAAFALLGVARAGETVSALNIILEFCSEGDRPTYIGLTNTLLAPMRTLSPLIGGVLAATLGYHGLFAVALALSLAGAAMLAAWVREPRQRPAGA